MELIEIIRESILKLDPIAGIDHILNHEKNLTSEDEKELITMKTAYYRKQRDFIAGLCSQNELDIYRNNFNLNLLNLTDQIVDQLTNHQNLSSKNQLEVETNRTKEVLFNKSQIILKIIDDNKSYVLDFKTNYFTNTLFIEDKNFDRPKSIFNLLSYHKVFPFFIGDEKNNYKLIVIFSIFSGLIKTYSLVKQNEIVLESNA